MDSAQQEVIESILDRFNGFLYRSSTGNDYTLLYASKGIEHLLGYPVEDFINDSVRTYESIVYEDDKVRLFDDSTRAIESRQSWNIDYRIVSRDGVRIWINDLGGPIFDDHGQLIAIEGAVTVIDAKKEAEAQREMLVEAAAGASEEIIVATNAIFKLLSALRNLALNARIEAARSGEAGLGFSVVAKEMDTLARQTGDLAGQIDTSTDRLRRAFQSVGAKFRSDL